MDEFHLTEEDEYAIEIAVDSARLFLRERRLPPQSIIGLGNALYALERLPVATEGVNCEFGIFYEHGDKEFRESKFYDFRITEDFFEITIGGNIYHKTTGSDSISEPGWLVERDGVAIRDAELYYLLENIQSYINQGANVVVVDESDFELI